MASHRGRLREYATQLSRRLPVREGTMHPISMFRQYLQSSDGMDRHDVQT
jgi:hypothetical protein